MGKAHKPWENIDAATAAKMIEDWDNHTNTDLSKSVGRIIIAWSQLDLIIQLFLNKIMDVRIDYFLSSVGQLDVYQKINALHALSSNQAPDELWLSHMTELRNYVCGALRGERNRIAHDTWGIEKDDPHSLDFKTRFDSSLKEPQYYNQRDRSIPDLDLLCAKIIGCCNLVKKLLDAYFQNKPQPSPRTHQEVSP